MSTEADESLCHRVAGIMGPTSAAARAIVELERRRAEGKQARVTHVNHRGEKLWLVSNLHQPPTPETKPPGEG